MPVRAGASEKIQEICGFHAVTLHRHDSIEACRDTIVLRRRGVFMPRCNACAEGVFDSMLRVGRDGSKKTFSVVASSLFRFVCRGEKRFRMCFRSEKASKKIWKEIASVFLQIDSLIVHYPFRADYSADVCKSVIVHHRVYVQCVCLRTAMR